MGVGCMADAAPAEESKTAALDAKSQPPSSSAQIVNPYARVDWDKVEHLHSVSHTHSDHPSDPQRLWDMGIGHLPISNYYPSRPFYPLPDAFVKKQPTALGAPNAEHHSMTNSSVHFCSPGSFYSTGYGQTPHIEAGKAPIEHVFSGLNVFDAKKSPWLGIYRLELRMEAPAGSDRGPTASLTIEGAVEVNPRTFASRGDGVVRGRRLAAKSKKRIFLKANSDAVRVRLDFYPASTQITWLRLGQGTNRPWRDAFRATLDGTLKDAEGRPVEGLLFPDGGGITINHPRLSLLSILAMLDFDPRVLGIEVWNQHFGFDGPRMRFYKSWDDVLRTGRRCFGFFVKDHAVHGRGRNVLLVSWPSSATRMEREHEALRAYREGRFFGLLGALTTDESGKVVTPYDKSDFRFTRIAVKEDQTGRPVGVEASVAGADQSKRPNTQIRFVTDAGAAHVVNGDRAYFEFPRDAAGNILCRYVRVEAFAYPNTHLGGKPLTAEAITAMNVHEISRIHDQLGHFEMSHLDPAGQAPIPIVDMIFSQPILVRASQSAL